MKNSSAGDLILARKARRQGAKKMLVILQGLAPLGLVALPDGRNVHILKHDAAVASFIRDRVVTLANQAIADRGAFAMSIGSGTTVKPLVQLATDIDWSKVHLFFGNDRTEGEAAGKCFDGAQEFISTCGIPTSNVHRAPSLPAEESAAAYEAELRACEVVGVNGRSGLPALDLVLLGSGADGHCASLYPESSQVVCSPDSGRVYLAAEGKGGITLSIDAINSARNVILSAGKPAQADMVRKCLGWSNAATNHKLPAGMIAASEETAVEWLLTEESAVGLPALV